MIFLYNIAIQLYFWAIKIASLRKEKARKWLEGRQDIFQKIEQKIQGNTAPVIWFHTASLGEFEQGRPVIEKIREKYPDYKIFVTFFSPSGYEVRKKYEKADYIFYLPPDTKSNAQAFLNLIQPKAVFFVKYEFWYHHLREVQQRQIPLILFSAVFREKQVFFQWYGGVFKELLKGFSHIFVQNESSLKLLQKFQLSSVSVAGDTRFDRVRETCRNATSIAAAEAFKDRQKLLIIGSCRGRDLDVLLPFIEEFSSPLKVVIAPHEIKESTFKRIEKTLSRKTIRYSQIQQQDLKQYDVLLIDNVGMLAALYQYGDFAFVGGAFGEGLHNILEPATFGMPVFFGKEYRKFPEAGDLIQSGGAFSIQNKEMLQQKFSQLYQDETQHKKAGDAAKNYILENTGGAEKVFRYFQNTQPS